ncbi:MAG: anti-sigma factor [Bacteroidota bacterium]
MSEKEIIESGRLEAYVLGELSEMESQEIYALAQSNEEIREEIERIELTLEKMAMKTAIMPDQKLKNSIFQQIPEKEKVIPKKAETKIIPLSVYLAAASIALFLITGILAINYRIKWKQTEERLSSLITQNQSIAQDYNRVNQRLDELETGFEIVNNSSFSKVVMPGTEGAPDAIASVYWNENSDEVYLSIQNLKQLSKEQQYQLWAIVDGVPVDAGIFNGDENSPIIKMKSVAGIASAFAVTIEPNGGSDSPSLETMQVYGEVSEET